MKRSLLRLLLLAASVALAGCFPEQRIWWSPKGDRALVSVQDQLHLVTAGGDLGPALLAGVLPEHTSIQWVSWLPDGTGFVSGEERSAATWTELRKLISPEEAADIERMIPAILPLLEAAAKIARADVDAQTLEAAMRPLSKPRFTAALLAAFEANPAAVKELLQGYPAGAEYLEKLTTGKAAPNLSQLCLYKLANGKPVMRTPLVGSIVKPLGMPKVSPRHGAVAYLQISEDEETIKLMIAPLDGGPALEAASQLTAALDWTPDGRTLIFSAPLGVKDEKLQNISSVTVLQPDGALMKPAREQQPDQSWREFTGPDRLAVPRTMVTAVMLDHTSLRVLSDGRVLFASPTITLPKIAEDDLVEQHLYLIAADGKSVQAVPTKPGDLPADLGFFDVSPDGRFAAIVEGETDVVAVVDLNSGKTQIISPKHPSWKCKTQPAWKSATELTFAALDARNQPAWMLWTEADGAHSISAKWPAGAASDWLKEDKPQPQDAKPDPANPTPNSSPKR